MQPERLAIALATVLIVALFLPGFAEALPEPTPLLAELYTWMFDENNNSEGNQDGIARYVDFVRNNPDEEEFDREYRREISIIRGRQNYSRQQAREEIAGMVKAGKLPSYIISKGQYGYNPGINSVYATADVNLRSQPNTDAKVITVVKRGGNDLSGDGYVPPVVSDYLGEWISPQGDMWVLVNYRPSPSAKPDEQKLGWLSRDYVGFITDSQAAKMADIYENPEAYMADAPEYNEPKPAAKPAPQTQPQPRQVHVYQCVNCGKVWKMTNGEVPSTFGCPKKNARGNVIEWQDHIFNRLQ